ncbi:hypothetical protein GCM10009093_01580 [Brevundimonas terrae]|uniref:Lipoprotein n=1 Tax=Brevundimonas terrae TaxID=363631 RepID=A0ABN0XZQ9_9CAUL|nr:hypothetical protein [Brevundimonas terrae]NIJ27518.1 hypothetical protein [Brevundimonas terrae]
MKKSVYMLASVALLGLGACGQEAAKPVEQPSAPVQAAPEVLPALETANAQQFVPEGGSLVPLELGSEGTVNVTGTVTGYAAPVYAVAVAQGQTLTVDFKTDSTNLYMNISDAADHSGAALHRGEVEGAKATLVAPRNMTFVIVPYQPRATARRNESGDFSLSVTRH